MSDDNLKVKLHLAETRLARLKDEAPSITRAARLILSSVTFSAERDKIVGDLLILHRMLEG